MAYVCAQQTLQTLFQALFRNYCSTHKHNHFPSLAFTSHRRSCTVYIFSNVKIIKDLNYDLTGAFNKKKQEIKILRGSSYYVIEDPIVHTLGIQYTLSSYLHLYNMYTQ